MIEIDTKYYVYHHINKDNGDIFYVGKGTGRRCYDTFGRNKFWKRYINKYKNYEVVIVYNNLNEDEAYKIEASEVERIGRRITKTGTLVNILPGGKSFPEEYILYREELEAELNSSYDIDRKEIGRMEMMLIIDEFMKKVNSNPLKHKVYNKENDYHYLLKLESIVWKNCSNYEQKVKIILDEHNEYINELKKRKEFNSLKLVNDLPKAHIDKMIDFKEKRFKIWQKILE